VNIRCIATSPAKVFGDVANGALPFVPNNPPEIFPVSMGQEGQQSIDSLSCRVGCEFITVTISIARREAARFFAISGRPPTAPTLILIRRGGRRMQADQLLVACPKCRAWPMAVHAGKMRWMSAAPLVRFTCAKCGYQEERFGGALHQGRELATERS
jgi:ribosomal protein S27AE